MRNKFSTKWKASKQARKQRKYLANAPLHTQRRILSANLSEELGKKYARKSFPVRKNDNVKVMKGSFYGKTGKIDGVDRKNLRVSMEGIKKTKKDGTKINVWFNPSNLQIQELDLNDKKRMQALSKQKTELKPEGEKKNAS